MTTALDALKARLALIDGLRKAGTVMSWDQDTQMPPGGAASRAKALGAVSRVAHEMATSAEFAQLLEAAEAEGQRLPADSDDARLLWAVRRDFEQDVKLPAAFVAELRATTSTANQVWQAARKANDYARYAPNLAEMIALQRQKADYLGHQDHPYDALLDLFEPELRTADVRRVFDDLRAQTVPLVQAIAARQTVVDDRCLHQPFDEAAQWALAHEVVALFGYDFDQGRIDRSAHPYCTTFGHGDIRMTLRVDPTFFNTCFFAACHECGHALYNQGLPEKFAGTPLFRGASSAIHESQSRLWENLIGRSRPFWQFFYPRLQEKFPDQLGDVAMDSFYRAVNRSRPSLNRVEADEVTYNLHIMLRFDLEVAMFEGEVDVQVLPRLWNEKMEEYLGVTPPDDSEGVMQDTHWSSGLFGYFPTYSLGNVVSVQLWEKAQQDLPDLDQQIASGEFQPILDWMRQNVHQHARTLLPQELLLQATGQPMTAQPYVTYLERKYGAIYDIGGG